MSDAVPPSTATPYNQRKAGYYGELGSGANARVKFLQTAMSHDELDKVTLIQNIPGSEKWDVRNLFQRDVDMDRVTHQILPYLKNTELVKYFNPLTLVLLPLTNGQAGVERDLRPVVSQPVTEGDHQYECMEMEGFFRFKAHKENPEYSSVEWNDRRVRVVAIDGQHRLSALKRWKSEPGGMGELVSWNVPVIVLGIVKDIPEHRAANVLEIVRRTFVYINSRAEQVNRSRRLLLDDESVNALCVQELIQASHANDVLPLEERNPATLPLLFFDWRGETRQGQPDPAPAAVKSSIEISEWMGEYILGGDGEEKQETRLELSDLIPPLKANDLEQVVSHEDARRIRERFRDVIYPGVAYLLEHFAPYEQYNREVRVLEQKALNGSDLAKHAFAKLRFGSYQADQSLVEDVQRKFEELVQDLEGIKNRLFPELIARDVGMRGVVAAFDLLKQFRDSRRKETIPWREFAVWFVDGINQVFEENWFDSFGMQDKVRKRLLTHVVFDPAGSIVNYKVRDAGAALGTFLALLVMSKLAEPMELAEAWQDYAEYLRVPLRRGYRKLIRAELKDTFEGTSTEFKAEVNKQADHKVDEHLKDFEQYLDVQRT